MRPAVLIGSGIAAGVLAWWFFGDDEEGGVLGDLRQAFNDALNGVTRGGRASNCPYDKTTGVVPCDPQQLADHAGEELETYSLGRALSSEEGRSSDAIKALVGHAIKNEADRRGVSITHLVTSAKLAAHAGHYGTQRNIEEGTDGYNASDRYCSTANDPYDGDLAIARGVLDGSIPDLTGGATQFDRPSGESDPERVAQNRINAGSELVPGLEDIVGDDLRFWRTVN
jgi:hypothetical protein